jgi:hypothetical protein
MGSATIWSQREHPPDASGTRHVGGLIANRWLRAPVAIPSTRCGPDTPVVSIAAVAGSAPAGEFDNALAGLQRAPPFGTLDDRQGHPVLVASGRIATFELDEYVGGAGRHDLAQPYQRRRADGFEHG